MNFLGLELELVLRLSSSIFTIYDLQANKK